MKRNKEKKISLKPKKRVSLFKDAGEAFSKMQLATQRLKERLDKSITKLEEILEFINTRIQVSESYFQKVSNTNENVEDILYNVLLAIRQNEYLQAWYPAQNGFPEMKVVGSHPCKLKQKQPIQT